jgi:UTP--glucose-1-phosphate uridylyltransferase
MVGHESFVVALGDSIIGMHAKSRIVRRMTEIFDRERADAVIAFETVAPADVVQYGIARPGQQRNDCFELQDLVEKPSPQEAPSCLAVAARYVFRPTIFEFLERTSAGKGNEIQLTDAIGSLIREGGRVLGVTLSAGERRFDIGNFSSYFRAFFEFALDDPELGSDLRQFVRQLLKDDARA